jgi:hypothetical protein
MTQWEAVHEAMLDHNAVTFTRVSDHEWMREYVCWWRKASDHNRKVAVASLQHVRRVAGVGLMLGAIVQQYCSDCGLDGLEISR